MLSKLKYGFYFSMVMAFLTMGNTYVTAQGWLNTYDNFFYLYQIVPDTAGGYYLGGFEQVDATSSAAVISKINNEGELLWKQNFHPGARVTGLVKTTSGKLAVLTRKSGANITTDSIHLHIFSLNGQLEAAYFVKETGNTDPFPSGDLFELSNQRLICAGTENIISNPAGTVWSMNMIGEILWERDSVDMTGVFDAFAADQQIVLSGRIRYPGQIEQDGLLYFDSLGNNTGALIYPAFAGSAKIIRLGDGLLYYSANSSFDAIIRYINEEAETAWSVQDMTLISESAQVVCGGADGGFFIAGISRSPDFLGQLVLQSYNDAGEVQQVNKITLPGYEQKSLYLTTMVPANDGGFIIAGGITLSSSLTKYFTAKIDTTGQVYEHVVIGRVFSDTDMSCSYNAGEQDLAGHKVRVLNITKNTESVYLTDNNGLIELIVDNDSLVFSVLTPNPYWQNNCFQELALSIQPGLPSDTTLIDFPLTAVVDCGFLEVDMGTTHLNCGGNSYQVQYCNTGTIPVSDAYIVISLDPDMQLLDAERPFTATGSNTYRFDLEPVPVGDCFSFAANVYLDCTNSTLEETHCVSAHIYPDTFCLSNLGWSGASVAVTGECQGDSVVFLIQNVGNAQNATTLEYRIIEDIIVYLDEFGSGDFQLLPGASIEVKVPANGSTWRLEADQEPNHPGNSMPTAVVEGCGTDVSGNFSTGFVSQFGEDDADPFVSIDCRSSNDFSKAGFPLGVGEEHLIEPGQDIEYIILFRNTGTDTVHQVIIRDTLSALLDPASVIPGAASHPYTFELYGQGYLKWTFHPIALPDSNVNAATSAGFVKFRVKQRDNLLAGAVITNTAAIYFDNEAPVLTNTTYHRIDTSFLQYCFINSNESRQLQIWPNPVSPEAIIFIPEVPCGTVRLLDTSGKLVAEQDYSGGKLQLQGADRLSDGLYLIQVFNENKWIGTGKVVMVR